ncbi:MAG: hypothetical protein AB7I18_14185 [Candidatus Berkiella sp.]
MLKTGLSWVIVRVWLRKDSDGKFTTLSFSNNLSNFGHCSLQTSDLYSSYYPPAEVKTLNETVRNFIGESRAICVDSFELDKALNNNTEPDVEVVLYGLNVEKINTSIVDFQKNAVVTNSDLYPGHQFYIFAGTGLFGNIPKIFNSDHIYNLLNAGGIKKYGDWDWLTKNNLAVQPHAIAKMSLYAASMPKEVSLASTSVLPPGISQRIKRPPENLNGILDLSGVGWLMESPGKPCAIM